MAKERKPNRKVSYNDIQNIDEDWMLDEREDKPYSGESVQKFIKKTLNAKIGVIAFDQDNSQYLGFADEESSQTYFEAADKSEVAYLVLARFDAPAPYTASINLISDIDNTILSGKTGNYIKFNFDIKDRSGASTGDPVSVTYSFINGGTTQRVTHVYNANETVEMLVDPYLRDGINNVTIILTGRNNPVSTSITVKYVVVALRLSSNFDFATPVIQGNYITVPYVLEGANIKYLEWFIDGSKIATETIADATRYGERNINSSNLSPNRHTLAIRAYIIGSDDTVYYGDTLVFTFVIIPAQSRPPLLCVLSARTFYIDTEEMPETFPALEVSPFDTISFKVALYDNNSGVHNLQILDNSVVYTTLNLPTGDVEDINYIPFREGNHTLQAVIEGQTETLLEVTAVGEGESYEEATTNMTLKLSAVGRSNSEENPASWTYGNVTTTFTNFSWNARAGWVNDTLIIPAGSTVQINFEPLLGTDINKGKTIEIDYETSQIVDENAEILSIADPNSDGGFFMTASSVSLVSKGGAKIDTKFKGGDRTHLAFIINRNLGDSDPLMYIVNNGILERVTNFASTDSFNIGGKFIFNSSGCTIKIHSIKVYDRALSVDEAFKNYVVTADNSAELISRNNILDSTGAIDIDKVNTLVPVMILTGDMTVVFNETKNNKVRAIIDVEYRNLQDPTKNFKATGVRVTPQGRSTLIYPRKNLRLYTNKEANTKLYDWEGNLVPSRLYSFKDGSQPVDAWTLKADYPESSMSHNTGVARLWDKVAKTAQLDGENFLLTEAQKKAMSMDYPYDVRTTIDGFPIILYHRQTEDAALTCLGQYNFNNDKSSESVYGFKLPPEIGFDNTNVQCFQFEDNNDPLCLFTFEGDINDREEYPDEDVLNSYSVRYPNISNPDTTKLRRFIAWVNACRNNPTKFRNEKADYLDMPKMCAYYVYLMRYGAVDQTVNNANIMTEDGSHWFFILYDNDTTMGIDNNSRLFNAWDFDRQSIWPMNHNYYFSGHDSVLWNLFENDPDLMAMVKRVDQALYEVGLNYAQSIDMFDNKQCGQWCERLYNASMDFKYIQPYKSSSANYLYMLHGNRKSYRHWFLKNRMEKYDAIYYNSAYMNRAITLRFISLRDSDVYSFTITAAVPTYFSYNIGRMYQSEQVYLEAGESHTFTISESMEIGTIVYLHNANNISSFELSGNTMQYVGAIDLSASIVEGESKLRTLKLGKAGLTNASVLDLSGLNNLSEIEYVDITGFTGITTLPFSNMYNLHVLKAANSGLTSFTPMAGAILTNVVLPDNINSIELDGVTLSNMTYGYTRLRNLALKNVKGSFDYESLVADWVEYLEEHNLLHDVYLTLEGINWTNVPFSLAKALGKVPNKTLTGRITLSATPTEEQCIELEGYFGTNIWSPTSRFCIDAPTGYAGYNILPSTDILIPKEEGGVNTATVYMRVFPIISGVEFTLSGSYRNISLTQSGNSCVLSVGYNASEGFVYVVAQYNSGTKQLSFRTINGTTLAECLYNYNPALCANPEYLTDEEAANLTSADFYNARTHNVTSWKNLISVAGFEKCTGITVFHISGIFEDCSKLTSVTLPPNMQRVAISTFKGCTRLSEVVLNEGLTKIEAQAFQNCTNLRSIEFPSSLTHLESAAFYGTRIANIFIPANVTYISNAFYGMGLGSSSSSIEVATGNMVYDSRNNCNAIIKTSTNELICACKNTVIPNDVVTISNLAFYGINFDTFVIPDNVVTVDTTFGTQTIGTLVIGSGVATFPVRDSLIFVEHIRVSENNTVYDSRDNCDAIILTESNTIIWGSDNTVIPSSVSRIDNNAFLQCRFEHITIPSGITYIGSKAFYNCVYLKDITIPGTVAFVESSIASAYSRYLCAHCSDLETAVIGDGVNIIPIGMFQSCYSLSSVTLPNSITAIHEKAFYGCALQTITIPNNVTTIETEAFRNNHLTSIDFGSSVQSLGDSALRDNVNLGTLIFRSQTQPTAESYTFSGVGTQVTGDKIVYCPAGSNYSLDGTGWSVLRDNGFVLSATL